MVPAMFRVTMGWFETWRILTGNSNNNEWAVMNVNITNPDILIKDLTETEILSAVRERFDGQLVADMDMEALIDGSTTLGDLYAAIQSEIDLRGK